jgi:hypothetical protein
LAQSRSKTSDVKSAGHALVRSDDIPLNRGPSAEIRERFALQGDSEAQWFRQMQLRGEFGARGYSALASKDPTRAGPAAHGEGSAALGVLR